MFNKIWENTVFERVMLLIMITSFLMYYDVILVNFNVLWVTQIITATVLVVRLIVKGIIINGKNDTDYRK